MLVTNFAISLVYMSFLEICLFSISVVFNLNLLSLHSIQDGFSQAFTLDFAYENSNLCRDYGLRLFE